MPACLAKVCRARPIAVLTRTLTPVVIDPPVPREIHCEPTGCPDGSQVCPDACSNPDAYDLTTDVLN